MCLSQIEVFYSHKLLNLNHADNPFEYILFTKKKTKEFDFNKRLTTYGCGTN